MISIHDPNVTKIVFQLTTVHGDPDLFVSRLTKLPTPFEFEKRSIRCGIYPEQVEYVKEGNKTLEGEYYITVYGYVQSTFSLVYFAHTSQENNEAIVKLTLGMKQKGVLKSTKESGVFSFKLSNEIKEDVEVRL